MEEHVLRLRTRLVGKRTRFWGECSCGWRSQELPSAGTVHGEHGGHLESIEAVKGATPPTDSVDGGADLAEGGTEGGP